MTIEKLIFLEGFIKTCEDNMLIIVFESLCYVRPKCFELLRLFSDCSLIYDLKIITRPTKTINFEPASVPMIVNNDIETIGKTVVNDFFHTRHPSLVNRHFGFIREMPHYP